MLTTGESTPNGSRFARVLAVDDQEQFLAVIRRVVEGAPGLQLVAEATSGEEALRAAARLSPDLVLMDVAMAGIGGLTAAKELKSRAPSTIVVLLSSTHPDELVREAAHCRADEVVWKCDLRPGRLEEIWQNHSRR
jgi:DNA-binding NarL/FixJ family response regulator